MDQSTDRLTIERLGLIDYATAWELQKKQVSSRQADEAKDTLFLCEHNHVYTFGKSANQDNLLISDAFLASINAQKFQIERGGDITYHGPGQLVGYPILDLHGLNMGVKKYVDLLEQSIITTLSSYNIHTKRIDGLTGIWLVDGPPRKIGAIGIKVSRGITMHGFALNVNTDLTYFNHIVPCGISDKSVTSMQQELGKEVDWDSLQDNYVSTFKDLFFS
ncbi:MAG: lipoyl(octanoyl) transferase LipB [Bacteroidetes bacterium]|jgi:lipoyl(octanoyl) transferase|nr:lipoyl(octanoyl) transferase LipB [Bacteroidota bacterium]